MGSQTHCIHRDSNYCPDCAIDLIADRDLFRIALRTIHRRQGDPGGLTVSESDLIQDALAKDRRLLAQERRTARGLS